MKILKLTLPSKPGTFTKKYTPGRFLGASAGVTLYFLSDPKAGAEDCTFTIITELQVLTEAAAKKLGGYLGSVPSATGLRLYIFGTCFA
jgi:hypothetical protein